MTVDELLEQAVAGGVTRGFVAVVDDRDGAVVEAAAGETGPDTVFRIASMTKAMASVAALQLIERGALALGPVEGGGGRAGGQGGAAPDPCVGRAAGPRGLRGRRAAPAPACIAGADPAS